MCRPDEPIENPGGLRHVIVSGAGPAGLLLTVLLLQRNEELPTPLYRVTLVDNRADLGALSADELKKRYRSWMLGLAGHGVEALQRVQDGKLYREYCQEVGIAMLSASIHLGSKEMKQSAGDPGSPDYVEGFIVDRNFIVAALARYIRDLGTRESVRDQVTSLYDHRILYVDYDNRRVLVRPTDGGEERYLDYDLLVGADGCRSVVREALVKRHSTFEMDVGDIFQNFKAVHVQRPEKVDAGSIHLLVNCFPSMTGIALPETGDMLNISVGTPRHLFDGNAMPLELKSDDPNVVAKYVRENFKAFELTDYQDFAQQWVDQQWNRTAQVHCNFYHSTDINVVIMGDAAHATSPSIGMGMNTALRDAQVFYELLQQHKDNLEEVLPAFSELRVKEGNSLSDMAMHLFCMDSKQQIYESLHMVIRGQLHKLFPSWIVDHPQALIGKRGYSLSDVYNLATQLGIMAKHRRINDGIRREYFEQKTGMVVPLTSSAGFLKSAMVFGGLAAVLVAVFANRTVQA